MRCICVQVYKDPAADQSVEVAELRRKIGSIDADITLVNKWLEESQGMCLVFIIMYRKMPKRHNINAMYWHYRWCCCR